MYPLATKYIYIISVIKLDIKQALVQLNLHEYYCT